MNLDLSFYFECLKKGKNKIPDEFDTCLICHNEYVDNSILAIPNCCNKKVSFHKECIKTWLKNNETCPNCRYIYKYDRLYTCLLYTSPSPRDGLLSRMPSSA